MVDNLPAALVACDDGIAHFRTNGTSEDVAGLLSLRANILKQHAFPLSQESSRYPEARPLILAAIDNLAESFALLPPEPGEFDREVEGIARVAARVGVTGAEFVLPAAPDAVRSLLHAHFSPIALQRSRAMQLSNAGAEAFNRRDYVAAAELGAQAFAAMPTETPQDTAFRAVIAYQWGLSILRASRLEDVSPKAIPDSKLAAANEMRRIWGTALQSLAELDEDTVREFNEDLAPGAKKAMVNDGLMRGEIVFHVGVALVNQGQTQEAARRLQEALDFLDPRVPAHRALIGRAQSTLAQLRGNAGHREGVMTKEEFRRSFDALVQNNTKTLRIMRGAADVHSLDMDKVMEGGQKSFANYDPTMLSHISTALRAGKQVAISAAGRDNLLVFAAVGLFRT